MVAYSNSLTQNSEYIAQMTIFTHVELLVRCTCVEDERSLISTRYCDTKHLVVRCLVFLSTKSDNAYFIDLDADKYVINFKPN